MTKISIESLFLKYPTSMISDALDEIEINGAISGVFPQRYDQGRISGRALPVKFNKKSSDPEAWRFGGGVGKPLEQVLKTMTAGKIIVMDLEGTLNATAWGGLASKLAQKKGVLGTIMYGTCRDVEEIRECGYPVWAKGVCPRRSRNDFTFGTINEPIEVTYVISNGEAGNGASEFSFTGTLLGNKRDSDNNQPVFNGDISLVTVNA